MCNDTMAISKGTTQESYIAMNASVPGQLLQWVRTTKWNIFHFWFTVTGSEQLCLLVVQLIRKNNHGNTFHSFPFEDGSFYNNRHPTYVTLKSKEPLIVVFQMTELSQLLQWWKDSVTNEQNHPKLKMTENSGRPIKSNQNKCYYCLARGCLSLHLVSTEIILIT